MNEQSTNKKTEHVLGYVFSILIFIWEIYIVLAIRQFPVKWSYYILLAIAIALFLKSLLEDLQKDKWAEKINVVLHVLVVCYLFCDILQAIITVYFLK